MDGKEEERKDQVKSGINILKQEEWIFSKNNIIKDQNNLTEDMSRANFKQNVWNKRYKGHELYVICENLTRKVAMELHKNYGHPRIRKTWIINMENYITNNDYKIIKDS